VPIFSLLSTAVIRHPRAVVLGWLVLAAGLYFAAPPWERVIKDDDVRFFPADSPSVIGQDLLERGFPQDASSSEIVLLYERRDGRLNPGDLSFVDGEAAIVSAFAQKHPDLGISKIETYRAPVLGPRLFGSSADGRDQAVLSIVSLSSTHLAQKTQLVVEELVEAIGAGNHALPAGLRRVVTGSAVVGRDTNAATNESIENTTKTTVVLVMVILLVVYRSPLLAMVPLFTIALSVFTALKLSALLTSAPALGIQIIDMTPMFVVVVLFGAGTDYCLFLVARYREELRRGEPASAALRQAIGQVAAALVASAATVIVGLGMLGFSSFAKIRYTGPTIALCLAVALLASLTLAPAILVWIGTALFWPFRAPHREAELKSPAESAARDAAESAAGAASNIETRPGGVWGWVGDVVIRYPVTILVVCLTILAPLAVRGACAKANYSQLADLDADRPSVVGADLARRYFAVGELSPAVVLIEHPALDFRSARGRTAIEEISRRLAALGSVAEVRAATRPLGKPQAPAADQSLFGRWADQAVFFAAESRYTSTNPRRAADLNRITRLEIVFKTDPFSESSLRALDEVSAKLRTAAAAGHPLEGATAIGLVGATASINDLKRVTTGDQRRMYILVTLGVYAVLVALLRRPGLSLYLSATVVLGYLASLGITDLLFRALHRSPAPWEGLDWTVSFFLFVILAAVGEDYNILLMARVNEEQRTHGVIEGTRRAVAQTGGIISSCGVIMAGTFGSMLTGSLVSLRELGFALALGVLLDTFLVRPILVPAFVILQEKAKRSIAAGATAGRWKRGP
jgi:putative drug exporter of the RND superfamily